MARTVQDGGCAREDAGPGAAEQRTASLLIKPEPEFKLAMRWACRRLERTLVARNDARASLGVVERGCRQGSG